MLTQQAIWDQCFDILSRMKLPRNEVVRCVNKAIFNSEMRLFKTAPSVVQYPVFTHTRSAHTRRQPKYRHSLCTTTHKIKSHKDRDVLYRTSEEKGLFSDDEYINMKMAA